MWVLVVIFVLVCGGFGCSLLWVVFLVFGWGLNFDVCCLVMGDCCVLLGCCVIGWVGWLVCFVVVVCCSWCFTGFVGLILVWGWGGVFGGWF